MIDHKRLKGVIPVQYCPYTKNDELDLEGLKENTKFLVDFAGEDKDIVIMTNGSTTEFYANSIEEQKQVIKTVVDTVNGRLPVVAGVSQPAAVRTIEMAKYAEETGADFAMVVLPYYHAPTKEGMYRYYEEIANAVNIGIMIYNNPDVSGTLMPPDLVARLSKIDNIVAIKDNATNAADYAFKALNIAEEDMILSCGVGEIHYIAAAAYNDKYKGFVSFIANFAPELSYNVYKAVKNKNFAAAYEALKKVTSIYELLAKFMNRRDSVSVIPKSIRTNYMYMSVGKAAMELVGLNGGSLRLPCEDITDEEKEELKKLLEKIDVV